MEKFCSQESAVNIAPTTVERKPLNLKIQYANAIHDMLNTIDIHHEALRTLQIDERHILQDAYDYFRPDHWGDRGDQLPAYLMDNHMLYRANGIIAGGCTLTQSSGYLVLELLWSAVERKGIGKRIITMAMQQAKESGATLLLLSAEKQVPFYTHLGFKVHCPLPAYTNPPALFAESTSTSYVCTWKPG